MNLSEKRQADPARRVTAVFLGVFVTLRATACSCQEVIYIEPPKHSGPSLGEIQAKYKDAQRSGADATKGTFNVLNSIRDMWLDHQAQAKIESQKDALNSKLSNGGMVVYFVGTQQATVGIEGETVQFQGEPEYVGSGTNYDQIRDDYVIETSKVAKVSATRASPGAKLNNKDSHFIIVTKNPDGSLSFQTKYEYGDLLKTALNNRKASQAMKYIETTGIGSPALPFKSYQQKQLDRQIEEILEDARERNAREQQARERELQRSDRPERDRPAIEKPFIDKPSRGGDPGGDKSSKPDKTDKPAEKTPGPGPNKDGGPVVIIKG